MAGAHSAHNTFLTVLYKIATIVRELDVRVSRCLDSWLVTSSDSKANNRTLPSMKSMVKQSDDSNLNINDVRGSPLQSVRLVYCPGARGSTSVTMTGLFLEISSAIVSAFSCKHTIKIGVKH